ncbi:transcriptional regulator, AraC family [Mesonia phycicola]|uniref:Transcriptional regulator, AraC family n=1 Tax=Mesonia phycicola TaxID=579105 RepID=A0A1M6A2I3_9FLAO|nr:AraC family transcriptional regulator [Mesonia phycicola]SHI30714.1 transcriptional regulator, AraC family [Mesonia phycicola]
MKIRFKSIGFNNGELKKCFDKGMRTSLLLENKHSNLNVGTGELKEIHLNQAFVLHQNYNNVNLENHSLQIKQSQSVFLLQFVMEGNKTISINDIEYHLTRNTYNLFYIPSLSYTHNYFQTKKNILNIYFKESFLKDKMGKSFINNSKQYLEAKKENQFYSFFEKGLVVNKQLRNIINEFLTCSFEGVTKKSYLEAKLTELVLMALASNYSATKTYNLREADKENLIRIENYMRANLKEDLSIEKLSALAGFNTSKFKNDFKEVFKMPVFKYLTSLRIEKAIELILKHDYTISQASYEVGYKNPQHFTVAFKKKLGYLPSELLT